MSNNDSENVVKPSTPKPMAAKPIAPPLTPNGADTIAPKPMAPKPITPPSAPNGAKPMAPKPIATKPVQINRQERTDVSNYANVENNQPTSEKEEMKWWQYLVGLLFWVVVGYGVYHFFFSSKPVEQPAKPPVQEASVDVKKSKTENTVPKTSATANNVPAINMAAISKTMQTSADKEGNYVHSAALTIDGNIASCWTEGVEGLGIGESVSYNFNGTYKVSGIEIWIGHQKSTELFYQNARPTAIKVQGSDGYSKIFNLKDEKNVQRIQFAKAINVNSITLTVENATPGSKYADTCIAEVKFF